MEIFGIGSEPGPRIVQENATPLLGEGDSQGGGRGCSAPRSQHRSRRRQAKHLMQLGEQVAIRRSCSGGSERLLEAP